MCYTERIYNLLFMADLPSLPPLPDNSDDTADMKDDYRLPLEPLIVPLKDLVVFPTMIVSVYVRNPELIEAIEKASLQQELIGLVAQKHPRKPVPPTDNLYDVGTSASILQIVKGKKANDAMVVVEAVSRFKVKSYTQERPYLVGSIEPIEPTHGDSIKIRALVREVKEHMRMAGSEGGQMGPDVIAGLNAIQNVDEVADIACSFLKLELKEKQNLLGMTNTEKRLEKILGFLNREIQLLKIKQKIHTDITQELNKNERQYLLRKELERIKKELGEDEPNALGIEGMTDQQDIKELQKRIKAAKMPKSVEKIAQKELDRLKKSSLFRRNITWPGHILSGSVICRGHEAVLPKWM